MWKDDALFVFGELHVRGAAGGGGNKRGRHRAVGGVSDSALHGRQVVLSLPWWRGGGQDDTGTEGNGRHARQPPAG